MDPVSALMTAVQIARAVQAQLALMAKNREDCADTAERMGGLVNVLDQLKNNKHFIAMSSVTLNRLLSDMQKAQELITAIEAGAQLAKNKRAAIRAFFLAGDDSAQLAELNRRISQHMLDLQPGISIANAQAAQEDMSDVKAKLDRTTAMLEALQGLLIASSVTDAVSGSSKPAMRVKRTRTAPQDDEEQEEQEGDEGARSDGRAIRTADAVTQQQSAPPTPPPAPLGPKLGRALEVAAHQIVFGCFMAGLALTSNDASTRVTVLALAPLLPAGLMSAITAAVLIHIRSKMPPGQRMSVLALVGQLASRSLVPLQLYLAPAAGALAALTGRSFLGYSVGQDIDSDFHIALAGVAVGTAAFAASYLAAAAR